LSINPFTKGWIDPAVRERTGQYFG